MSVIDIQSTKLSLQLANIGLSPLYEPLSRWSRPNSLPCCLLLLPPNFPPGKRGLGSNDGIDLSGFEQIPAEKSKVRWQYNWNSDISGNKIAAAEFVPMLWSDRGDHTGQGSRHLLGFNEPDLGSQANMSPGYAAVAWRQWMNPYAGLARLGAPAVSNGGYNWLQQWLSVCSDCHFDFVPIHWYNPHDLEFDLEDWVNCVCRLTGKPVWVTEFKGLGSQEDQRAFLAEAMQFLESSSCVERYAYFGSADNDQDLIDSSSATHLSSLGNDYCLN